MNNFISKFVKLNYLQFLLKEKVGKMMIKNEEYLSFVESQQHFRICRTTIQKAVSDGKISYYRIGRKKMLSKKDLEEFIDSFFVNKRKPQGRPRNTRNN